jgi:hypothetical protein
LSAAARTALIFFLLFPLLATPSPGAKEGAEGLEKLRDEALSYFTPLEGRVTGVVEGAVYVDQGSKAGLKEGMRLDVFRKGEVFHHPITREPIGTAETRVAMAEVKETGPGYSELVLLEGEARPGDVVRLSSAKVRALFYQKLSVDWNVAEEYYLKLKESGRFELLDTAPGRAGPGEIAARARKSGARVAIVLSAENKGKGSLFLKQQVLWASDGSVLSEDAVSLGAGEVRDLSLGEEFFEPEKGVPSVAFTIPFNARFLRTADLDGDGQYEVLLASSDMVAAYSFKGSLVPALGGAEIKGDADEEFIWLDTLDFDGDGRDEVLITSKDDRGVKTTVYKYEGREFSVLRRDRNVYGRVLGGRLYAQERSPVGGYKGKVFAFDDRSETIELPHGVNIYDFGILRSPAGARYIAAYDWTGHLTVSTPDGTAIWRSRESYGPPVMEFDKKKVSASDSTETWRVNGRLVTRGRAVLGLKRVPLASLVRKLDYFKHSEVIALSTATGAEVDESVLINGVSGGARDFDVTDKDLFILTDSLSLSAGNILKGKGLFNTKVFVYTLVGD